ncbi:MAG: CDP-diacylglycerol--glycerol-3-phosphate 3-phosphatidyltransferase [Bdellovibrionales bacterium]|nr:CDP-diacylglycerol--glycerol-3-phosphate 3-phosphatidyltransferase [Bdellovibrionales bacterium]
MENQPESTKNIHQSDMDVANLPNTLTMLRMAAVPVVVACLFQKEVFWDWVAGWLFVAASLTDYLDGYYARKLGISTIFGKLMDPLADKFLVIAALVMLQELGRIHPVVVMLLICREVGITTLRALASAERLEVPSSAGGKWKTAVQMTGLPFMMAQEGWFGLPLYQIGYGLLLISLVISMWSAKDYVVDFFKAVRARRIHIKATKATKKKPKEPTQ